MDLTQIYIAINVNVSFRLSEINKFTPSLIIENWPFGKSEQKAHKVKKTVQFSKAHFEKPF